VAPLIVKIGMKARHLFFNLNMTSKSKNNSIQKFLLLAFICIVAFHLILAFTGSQSEISAVPPFPVFLPSMILGYLISRCSDIQPVVSPGQFVVLILQKFNIWHQSSDDDPFYFPSSLS
jgi:hypothetical protein